MLKINYYNSITDFIFCKYMYNFGFKQIFIVEFSVFVNN